MDGDFLGLPPNVARAGAIWCEADQDLDYTPADTYLCRLGGKPPWPASLRYLAECYNGPAGVALPALIAKIADINGTLTGVQRVYLDDDGDPPDIFYVAGDAGGKGVACFQKYVTGGPCSVGRREKQIERCECS